MHMAHLNPELQERLFENDGGGPLIREDIIPPVNIEDVVISGNPWCSPPGDSPRGNQVVNITAARNFLVTRTGMLPVIRNMSGEIFTKKLYKVQADTEVSMLHAGVQLSGVEITLNGFRYWIQDVTKTLSPGLLVYYNGIKLLFGGHLQPEPVQLDHKTSYQYWSKKDSNDAKWSSTVIVCFKLKRDDILTFVAV
jgi:hypothetical protein